MSRLINENTITQKQLILKHLKRNRKSGISDTQARELYGINRLSGRIYDLKADGYKIIFEWKNGMTRYGKKTRYKVYKLEVA